MPTSSSSSAAADDRRLVERFLGSREEGAFRELYRAHTPALYKLALRLERGRDGAAQDLVQEAWMRAVPKLGEFRWRSALRTWLSSVLINVHREAIRQRMSQTRRIQEARGRLSVVGTPVPELTPDLERAIAELPDGQREVLVLHDIEGYTHREIAELTGVAEGTSKSQLSRARRLLREWLGREGANHHAK